MSDTTGVPDDLVTAALTGDRQAVGRLLTLIRPLVVRYCRSRLGNLEGSSTSADDVAQEVCLAVLTALPGYRVQGRPFLAFVYGIAAHKVIDAHRASSRTRSEPVAALPDVADTADDPEQRALRIELSEEMDNLLGQLSEMERHILVLRVVVGLSAEETAKAVGATPGAVRVAQHRSLTRLRKSTIKLTVAATEGRRLGVTTVGRSVVERTWNAAHIASPSTDASTDDEVDVDVDAADALLRRSHQAHMAAITTGLDLDSGLVNLYERQLHHAFVATVASQLNLDAGLDAAFASRTDTTEEDAD